MQWIKKHLKDFFEKGDVFLFVMCIICSIYGIIAVYRATVGMSAGGALSNPAKFVFVQLLGMGLGIGSYIILTFIDSDVLGEHWPWLAGIIVFLLVALILFGQDDGTGNKGWIRFAGIGFQPSEAIKVIYIIIAAHQMAYMKEHSDVSSLINVVMMVGVFGIIFVGIIGVSSDLGSATVLMAIFIVLFYVVGVKLYWFAAGGAMVAALVPLMWEYFLKDYQKQRLVAPYDPSIDPTGYGITWQTTQSKMTLASGRLFGVGGNHTASVFTGKHTDFIFAAIGEEFGMIGCLIVTALLLIIIIHCFRVGLHATRNFDMLVCFGVGAAFAYQTLINVGMCIGITPVIGITLPFFSYGGSSMTMSFAAMGLISGIKYKPKPEMYSLSMYR